MIKANQVNAQALMLSQHGRLPGAVQAHHRGPSCCFHSFRDDSTNGASHECCRYDHGYPKPAMQITAPANYSALAKMLRIPCLTDLSQAGINAPFPASPAYPSMQAGLTCKPCCHKQQSNTTTPA